MRPLLPFEKQDLEASKLVTVYTDYPFIELGDKAGESAPMRQAQLISYDWNKYCCIKIDDQILEVKSGYLYKTPDGVNDDLAQSYADPVKLMLSNKEYAELQHAKRQVKSIYEITLEKKSGQEVKFTYPTLKLALAMAYSKGLELNATDIANDNDIHRLYLYKIKSARRWNDSDPLLEMDTDETTVFTSKNGRSILKNRHFNRFK